MTEKTLEKLKILAAAAKYDVSCASSGVSRGGGGALGGTSGWGVCHSFADDGRCVSLLKVLLSNYCAYDCAYCLNRASNDTPRASFEVEELAALTIEFYRRNYIEGLFLSSGIIRNADYTMERIVSVLRLLRETYGFGGYIHAKCVPGTGRELIVQAGRLADRLSVNVEIPSAANLKKLAPDKDHQRIYAPMRLIKQGLEETSEDRRRLAHTPSFVPAGQSTQLIIGASDENDRDILRLSSMLYQRARLKRVYYSGFIPVNAYDRRLPALAGPPLRREHRLYQADWLLRFYHFEPQEIADDTYPHLDLNLDPKSVWALRHPEFFPLDVNRADYTALLRVPGIGVRSAQRILQARSCRRLGDEHLAKLGVVMKRARFFLARSGQSHMNINHLGPEKVRVLLMDEDCPDKTGRTERPTLFQGNFRAISK
ncbi:MAG: putative DNA modification/repair radical SAM protein [Deltaproteobacteria bacterium]|nr:putative DNA modification/repair radical SAM protein [Deltaproteobacteria bacterium]